MAFADRTSIKAVPLRVVMVFAAALTALCGFSGMDFGFGVRPLTVHLVDLSQSHGSADEILTAFFLRARAAQPPLEGEHALMGFASGNLLLAPVMPAHEFVGPEVEGKARVSIAALPSDFSARTHFSEALSAALRLQRGNEHVLCVLHGDGRHAVPDWNALRAHTKLAFTHAGRLPGKHASAPSLALDGAPPLLLPGTWVSLPLLIHADASSAQDVLLVAGANRETITAFPGSTHVQFKVEVPHGALEVQLCLVGDSGGVRSTLRLPVETGTARTVRVIGAPAAVRMALSADTFVDGDADLVVLNDASVEGELDSAALAQIERAVKDGGAGLLILGGPHAFAAGGYAETQLDGLSPLVAGRSLAQDILVLLDASGSMEREQRLQRAVHACSELARNLGREDRLIVVPFTTTAGTPVPSEPVAAAEWTRSSTALAALLPSGGTALLPALDAAQRVPRALGRSRVMLILSDFDMADLRTQAAVGLARARAHEVAERVLAVVLDPAVGAEAVAAAIADEVRVVQGVAPQTLVEALRQSGWKAEPVLVSGAGNGLAPFEFAADGWNPVVAVQEAEVCAVDTQRGPLAAVRLAGRGSVAALAAHGSGPAWCAAVASLATRVARQPQPMARILSGPEGTRIVSATPFALESVLLECSDGSRILHRVNRACEYVSAVTAPAGPAQVVNELGYVLARGVVVRSADEELGWAPQRLPNLAQTAQDSGASWPLAALAAVLLALSFLMPRRVPFQSG